MVQAREIKKFLKLNGSALIEWICLLSFENRNIKLFYRFLQFFLSMCDQGP